MLLIHWTPTRESVQTAFKLKLVTGELHHSFVFLLPVMDKDCMPLHSAVKGLSIGFDFVHFLFVH